MCPMVLKFCLVNTGKGTMSYGTFSNDCFSLNLGLETSVPKRSCIDYDYKNFWVGSSSVSQYQSFPASLNDGYSFKYQLITPSLHDDTLGPYLSTIIFSYLSSEKLPPRLKQFVLIYESFILILKFSPSSVSYCFRLHWPTLSSSLARHRHTCCISLGLCCYVVFIPRRVLSRAERVAIIRVKVSFYFQQE